MVRSCVDLQTGEELGKKRAEEEKRRRKRKNKLTSGPIDFSGVRLAFGQKPDNLMGLNL